MKYLRRIVAMVITVVIFAAVVISLGVIFAVKNINVTLLTYSDDYSESYDSAKSSLNVLKGGSILFVKGSDIEKSVEGGNYSVASYEKIYPCTLNVTLKERLETFAVSDGGQYLMYDNDGLYLRKTAVNENINDGAPNVQLVGVSEKDIAGIALIAGTFKEVFKSLRSSVASIELDTKPELGDIYINRLIFNMRCGVKIVLVDYSNFTAEKIKKAFETFSTLSDRDKLRGTLRSYCLDGEEGIVKADYSPV